MGPSASPHFSFFPGVSVGVSYIEDVVLLHRSSETEKRAGKNKREDKSIDGVRMMKGKEKSAKTEKFSLFVGLMIRDGCARVEVNKSPYLNGPEFGQMNWR